VCELLILPFVTAMGYNEYNDGSIGTMCIKYRTLREERREKAEIHLLI
jgi:hypothetical protein